MIRCILLAVIAAGCARGRTHSSSPDGGSATMSTRAAPDAAAVFPRTISGQLDRIDACFRDPLVHPWRTDDEFLQGTPLRKAQEKAAFVPELRRISGITDPAIDLRAAYYLAVENAGEGNNNGFVSPAMLRKNPVKHAGSSAWLRDVKIIEIHEENGTTVARVLPRGETDAIAVLGRFESDFVDGDTVDAVGYHAGSFEYTSRGGMKLSIPAVAALTMVKRGGIMAMKKILPGFL